MKQYQIYVKVLLILLILAIPIIYLQQVYSEDSKKYPITFSNTFEIIDENIIGVQLWEFPAGSLINGNITRLEVNDSSNIDIFVLNEDRYQDLKDNDTIFPVSPLGTMFFIDNSFQFSEINDLPSIMYIAFKSSNLSVSPIRLNIDLDIVYESYFTRNLLNLSIQLILYALFIQIINIAYSKYKINNAIKSYNKKVREQEEEFYKNLSD